MQFLTKENSLPILSRLKMYLMWGIGATIAFSLLNLNSICIIGLTTIWLLETYAERSFVIKWTRLKTDPLFLAYSLYFLIGVAGILYTTDMTAGWKNAESKLGFLALPIIFCSSPLIDSSFRGKVLIGFSIAVTVASVYCLIVVTQQYWQTHDTSFFFYHSLVSPTSHHAIFFSCYVFVSLMFLLINKNLPAWLYNYKWIRIIWIIYNLLLLVLLASKLLLILLIPFTLIIFLRNYNTKRLKKQIIGPTILLSLLFIIAFSFDNPIKKRFTDLLSTNMTFLTQEKYSPNDYFNGLELRLLLWRFTYEILNEKKAWITGVGPADAQPALKEKYLSMNMYAGDKSRGDQGYLVFNCHNQFLQTSLQSGIIGLLILLFWCYILILKAWRKKDILLSATVMVTIAFFFTESVFERQYGMIFCTFFPLLLLYSDSTTKTPAHS